MSDHTEGTALTAPAAGRPAEPKPRLVVELNRAIARQLEELVELDEVNKTTVVNRAIKAYWMLRMAQERGEVVLFKHPNADQPRELVFL